MLKQSAANLREQSREPEVEPTEGKGAIDPQARCLDFWLSLGVSDTTCQLEEFPFLEFLYGICEIPPTYQKEWQLEIDVCWREHSEI